MRIDTLEVELKPKDTEKIKNKIAEELTKGGYTKVVRCKNCKNYEHIITAVDNEGNVTKECDFCDHWKRRIDVNDYCSYGEQEQEKEEKK